MLKTTLAICAALAALTWMHPAQAQQSLPSATNQTRNIKRIPLQRFDVPGTTYETVIGIAEIAPNVSIGRHTHPGPESGYVMEGGFELLIDGEPPRQLKAGESYKVPPGTIHDAKTAADGAKVIATYVVAKGQPLASSVK
jgi:quercetin dioxygenase-like cupin family protein